MNGIINILKPPGMTSHDVVSYIRKKTGIKKIGHTGTLDPGAAGILPVCIGKSTKIVDYIMNDKKTYICELKLGNKSNTYDKYGEFLFEKDLAVDHITHEIFNQALDDFKGEINQKPPAFSAIKVNGVRAYDLARQGKEVELPQRKVIIYEIDILSFSNPYIIIKVTCSKGTYIRSICNDIGEKLGCGAYMNFLIRTSTGSYSLDNSHLLDEINKENIGQLITPPEYALNFSSIYIDEEFKARVLNGNSIKIKNPSTYPNNELLKIFLKPDMFIALGRIENNLLQIEKLLI